MMKPRSKRALPGVLLFSIVVGACQDAPVGPRAPAMHATPEPAAEARVFSGRQSDSVLALAMAQWARLGHPEYQRAIDAWRREHLGTTRTDGLRDAPDARATGPSTLLTDGDGTVVNPPQIFSHREALHFGNSTGTPTILEGEMTFGGDLGKISVGSFTITRTSGATFSFGGDLANGPGQVNCLYLSTCSSKRLAGSIQPAGAPYCDATASGSVIYTAQNIQTSYGTSISPLLTVNTSGGSDVATLSQQVNATAPACTTTNDGTGSPSGGSWADPAPDPNPPPPLSPEPTYPTMPKDNYCYSYFDTAVLYVVVVCTAN